MDQFSEAGFDLVVVFNRVTFQQSKESVVISANRRVITILCRNSHKSVAT